MHFKRVETLVSVRGYISCVGRFVSNLKEQISTQSPPPFSIGGNPQNQRKPFIFPGFRVPSQCSILTDEKL